MFTIQNRIWNGRVSNALFILMAIGLMLLATPVALADNAVKLKVLVITTGDVTQDSGLAYIKPVLDEMGVQYDLLNTTTQDLTPVMLSPNGCTSETVGCVGNYNGFILTDTAFLPPPNNSNPITGFTASEWDVLHNYEKNFQVREAVLSGWPGTYWDPNPPFGIYLDYGLTYTSSIISTNVSNAKWTVPAPNSTNVTKVTNQFANTKTVFEYVNTANSLPITDHAYAAKPRNDAAGPRDGTVPTVTPLLQTPAGETLVSVIQYKIPLQTKVEREVLLSTVTNTWFLTHSQVLSYEFVNWVTKGVFVGGRFVYMSAHLDDLFLANDLWDVNANKTNELLSYRLSSGDISNAVSKQSAFRSAHKMAGTFKLDFAFNGAGAVVDPAATTLTANLTEDLVKAVVANKSQFRFINHTLTHADMDKVPVPANPNCDYPTLSTSALIQAEITKNKTVWGLLGLPEQSNNNRVIVTGNHSGLKDRKCTDYPELHPTMENVQSDDVPFISGANPLFINAASNAGVDYLASDTSQLNQATEQYVKVSSGKVVVSSSGRLILPRWPANIFFNVINPTQLVSEYNYIFHDRFVTLGQNPCDVAGAICATRNYNEILTAEANTALMHMLSFKKYPHFFHQGNVAKYNTAGNTLQFDWLNSVYTTYEKLFKLPVKNYPYYQIGDMTKEKLVAKSATINAVWNRTTNQVTLSANKSVPNLLVTGITGGDIYGGQSIRAINVNTTPKVIAVDQALTK